MSSSLFVHIVTITEEYLGPAAHRFVTRQVSSHLQKTPEEITVEDMPTLIEWVKLTLALVTEDRESIEEYASKLNRLASEHAVRS